MKKMPIILAFLTLSATAHAHDASPVVIADGSTVIEIANSTLIKPAVSLS